MNASRRNLCLALTVPVCFLAVGCTGPDNPKIADAPPPPPPTAAEKAEPKGKPPGYGTGDVYQKAMEKANTR
jgi:hypothetical protein